MRRGRTLHTTTRTAVVDRDPDSAYAVVASGHTGPQWYVDALPLRVRRTIDRVALGPALRVPPPGRPLLEVGDEVGFWVVDVADRGAGRLVLHAVLRSPGQVTLEVRCSPHAEGTEVRLSVTLSPRGLVGRVYELADLPARETVSELLMLHLLTILRRRDNPWAASSVDPV